MSLVEQAANKNLPSLQYMDSETLNWIIKNKPNFNKNYKLFSNLSDVKKLVIKFRVPQKWFLSSKIYDSLHGVRHAFRCIVYSVLLSRQLHLEKKAEINLIVAAAIHDVSRVDDKGSPHGRNAALWFHKNFEEVIKTFNISLNKNDIRLIQEAVALHDIPYEQFDKIRPGLYAKNKDLIDELKVVDALDRYRLPKLKWWIRSKFLKMRVPIELKRFAYELVVKSEKAHLMGKDNINSVLLSL